MKTEISPAIIMRAKEFGEADLLVAFFTPLKGQLKGIAKGARRSRKRFVNSLDLFSLVSLEYAAKKGGGLCFLHSGKLIDAFPGLRSDFGRLTVASYLIELTETLFPPGVTDQCVFELLKEALGALSEGERADRVSLLFEARAMALGGYRINTEKCCICRRAYRGEGLALFVREKGGIACLKCQKQSASSPSMDPECVRILEGIQEGPFAESLASEIPQDTFETLKTVLSLHREYRLEQRLKTTRYFD